MGVSFLESVAQRTGYLLCTPTGKEIEPALLSPHEFLCSASKAAFAHCEATGKTVHVVALRRDGGPDRVKKRRKERQWLRIVRVIDPYTVQRWKTAPEAFSTRAGRRRQFQ